MRNCKIAIALIATVLTFASCNSCNQNKTTIQAEPIKIGAVLPLTGDVASYGNKVKNGIELAKEISGSRIEISFEDSRSKPEVAISSINKLINQGVRIVIGEVSSGNTKAIAPTAEENKVLLLSPSASDATISTLGDYIFRAYPSDSYEGSELVKYISKKSYKDIYSITMLSDYGVGLKKVFAETAPLHGLTISGQYEYKQGETNYKTILSKIKNQHAAIVIVGYGTELGAIVRQAREMGLKNQFFSTINFYDQNSITAGGSAVEGVIFSALYLNTTSQEKPIADYAKKYKLKFNEEPDIWSALGFDCFNIINQTIVDSSSNINIEAVKNNLYNLRNFPGISGTTTFDKNGDVVKPINFMTVQNSKFILIN